MSRAEKEENLRKAAKAGNDVDAARKLIAEGTDVNAADSRGDTSLHEAAKGGHFGMVELLLESGAIVNITRKNGYTALIYAALYGHSDVVTMLLDKGANITRKNGYTALIYAALYGHSDVVTMLLDKGASLEAATKDGYTPLHYAAARYGKLEVAELLLARGARPDLRNKFGWTPLDVARREGQKEVVAVLERARQAAVMLIPSHTLHAAYHDDDVLLGWSIGVHHSLLLPTLTYLCPCCLSLQPAAPSPPTSPPPAAPLPPFDVPKHFVCPLSREIMTDPVMTTNGQTYERAFIEKWFQHHSTDPLLNTTVMKVVFPNRALNEAITDFNAQYATLKVTQQSVEDKELAVQVWMEETQSALMRKATAVQKVQESVQQVQESVQQIKLSVESLSDRLTDCERSLILTIPEDLVRRIADLEGVRDAAMQAQQVVLREKQDIVESSELLEYYVAVQSNMNGILLACGVISSKMVENEEKGVVGKVASVIDFAGQHTSLVPGASIALSVVSALLTAYDNSTQRERVDKVVGIFRNDAVLISQVTEMVAREMTKFHRDDLLGVVKGSAKKSSATIAERMKNAIKRCRASAVKSASKDLAQKHVESIMTAIMDGAIHVPYGDAITISEAIFSHATQI
eukprot:CAMPEP_0201113932 /NCGR_PEP_ID=MMETSP0812-20130820/78113_1 /ASSEMBLY_ACC=CAM_ASM_000668 /TAXON_ID=98059 /ORGANISM="Dinobryon sp., Strain UTEXLB2267" /LENGTH=630 /DNA_ID=CAMNT_0047377511 /DNA_START=50 /DNA_END=1943 /DNA_ORIENTATION=-